MATDATVFAGEFHEQRSLVVLQSMGSQKIGQS